MTRPRSLINEGGESFDETIPSIELALANLANADRDAYRSQNATDIATSSARRLLIVAGPGAGKSHLFLERIQHWLPLNPGSEVYVASFVRKLVGDLRVDVQHRVAEEDRDRVVVSTLHGLARSLLERNHGTRAQPMRPHIGIVAPPWSGLVWEDVRAFHPDTRSAGFSLGALERQFHTEDLDESAVWTALRQTYAVLCQFYNAVGFAVLVVLAREAVAENPSLSQHHFWIIDEFQDFNTAEEQLIRSLVEPAAGALIAGDDDQALYQQLKASHPDIVISYYADPDWANAMLPYCSRCSYYVCLASAAFIARDRPAVGIRKIFLPFEVNEDAARIRIVATAAPTSAVDYIKKFVADHATELAQHVAKMEAGEEKDPFLLILTHEKRARFYRTGGADAELRDWLAQWKAISGGRSDDYRQLALYYAAAANPSDNFALRRVLDYEDVPVAEAHPLIAEALDRGCALAEIEHELVTNALRKCKAVAALLNNEQLDVAETVAELARVVSIEHPAMLADELTTARLTVVQILAEDEEEEAIETAGAAAPVEMMTMVGSKGLSAQHVIVIGCDDVNLAHASRLSFFVAMTRARRSLHLVTSLKAGGATCAHGYVDELPPDYCEFVVYKKTGHVAEVLATRAAWTRRIAQWNRAMQSRR